MHTINVWAGKGGESIQQKSCVAPSKEDRKSLVEMSGCFTLVLSCLPSLGRGQLLHLGNCLFMPASKSLPWHGDEDDPLPPAGLTSLSHLPVVGSLQGTASLSSFG